VERERARPGAGGLEKLRFAADAGGHFLRMLGQQPLSRSYRDLFIDRFRFTPLADTERGLLDEDSLSFVDLVMPRLPDGRKLYAALRAALRPAPPARAALPPDVAIAPGDVAEVQLAAEAWLRWYETLITEPGDTASPWSAERMEYGFSV